MEIQGPWIPEIISPLLAGVEGLEGDLRLVRYFSPPEGDLCLASPLFCLLMLVS